VTVTITITTFAGESARSRLDLILPAYTEVYAEAPYHEGAAEVADFRDSWERRVTAPGFRLVVATDDVSEVVGFAFGHNLTATTGWWEGALTPLPPVATERPQRTFAVIELAVRKPFRRRGVAQRMHEELLAEVRADRVTLLVRPEPEAGPAQRAYAAWGYDKIGQIRPWPEAPVYDALLRPLPL